MLPQAILYGALSDESMFVKITIQVSYYFVLIEEAASAAPIINYR